MGLAITLVAVAGLLLLLILVGAAFATRYIKAGPNEVLVIAGRKHKSIDPATGEVGMRAYRIVKGGGTFIWPVLERLDRLSLEVMTIDVITPKVYTLQGVPVTVDGVAQVKIKGDEISIATAAEQFLSKNDQEIRNIALQTLEGHQRAILGTMTVEEIYRERDVFAQNVQEVAAADLANMGLGIVSFTIRDIQDEEGYLDALGKKRTAEVKRDAEIGEAEAKRDARKESAEANQAAREAEFRAETRIAEAEKEYKLQKASYDEEVARKEAIAEMAYQLQQTKEQQKVRAEEVEVEVVDRRKQIEVQEQEALRKERELEATVRKPADAERYRVETIANAERYEREAQAQAEAAVIKATGDAEAEVIRAKGDAEAEAMQRKAAAWQQYNQAAILDELLDRLPELAGAIASPLSKTDRIVIIGGNGDGSGAQKITQDVSGIMAQMPAVVESLTGIDMVTLLQELPALQRRQDSSQTAEAYDGRASDEAPLAPTDGEAEE